VGHGFNHFHSIVLNRGNTLNFRSKAFLRMAERRPTIRQRVFRQHVLRRFPNLPGFLPVSAIGDRIAVARPACEPAVCGQGNAWRIMISARS
jgi:hypothetical protein